MRSPFRWLGRLSLATRLFLSNVLWSTAILAVSGFILTEVNFHAAEQDFDERLGVYLRALVAAAAANGEWFPMRSLWPRQIVRIPAEASSGSMGPTAAKMMGS